MSVTVEIVHAKSLKPIAKAQVGESGSVLDIKKQIEKESKCPVQADPPCSDAVTATLMVCFRTVPVSGQNHASSRAK